MLQVAYAGPEAGARGILSLKTRVQELEKAMALTYKYNIKLRDGAAVSIRPFGRVFILGHPGARRGDRRLGSGSSAQSSRALQVLPLPPPNAKCRLDRQPQRKLRLRERGFRSVAGGALAGCEPSSPACWMHSPHTATVE